MPETNIRLSFGNILEKFPEFLIHVLRYIPDRKVWNSIVSSDRKIYKKIKEEQEDNAYLLPPWPMNFKLRVPGYDTCNLHNPVWSPDGTQIACSTGGPTDVHRIAIFDQRRGLLRFRRHGDDHGDNHNKRGWIPRYDPKLKFSPDGSFLVSVDGYFKNGHVRL